MTDAFEDRLRSELSDAGFRGDEIAARFSQDVVARVRRRRRLRRFVLMTAGGVGLAISGVGIEEIVRQTPLIRAGLAAALTSGPLYSVSIGVGLAFIVLEMLQGRAKA